MHHYWVSTIAPVGSPVCASCRFGGQIQLRERLLHVPDAGERCKCQARRLACSIPPSPPSLDPEKARKQQEMGDATLNTERFLSRLKRLHAQWTKGEKQGVCWGVGARVCVRWGGEYAWIRLPLAGCRDTCVYKHRPLLSSCARANSRTGCGRRNNRNMFGFVDLKPNSPSINDKRAYSISSMIMLHRPPAYFKPRAEAPEGLRVCRFDE